MLSAVIVEDESRYLASFKAMLSKNCPEIHLTGGCGSVKEAKEFIKEVKPDIVFLDIQLSDGDGFELLKQLEKEMAPADFRNIRVIFTTAHNQYAIQAFRLSAVDYLLKPIVPQELVEAVNKVVTLQNTVRGQDTYDVLFNNLSKSNNEKKICLSTLSEVRLCRINEILRCESEHNYTRFYFTDAKPLMVSKTLKEYEEMLTPYGFERVHQTHLVNLAYIKSYLKKDNGSILMSDGSIVPISRRKKDHLLKMIKNVD